MKVIKEDSTGKTIEADLSPKEAALEIFNYNASGYEIFEDDPILLIGDLEDYYPYKFNIKFDSYEERLECAKELCALFAENNKKALSSIEKEYFSNKITIADTLEEFSELPEQFGISIEHVVEMIIKNWNK